ncbi:MAG: hypothetical protein N2319_06830 [Candidatus Kapabacteria bacterium]|nr:hypothetical protein [Candidatus Kapabacteria bacterium]
MRLKSLIIPVIIILLFFISCDEKSLNFVKRNPLMGLLGLNDSTADMLLYTTSVYDYSRLTSNNDSNKVNVFAYITDGFDFVDPTSVIASNVKLTNMNDYVGQYSGLVDPFPQGPPYNISWIISGWSGRNYEGTQTISNKLELVDSHYLDTISSSNDFNILYTGYANEDSISIRILPASGENFYFLGMTSSPSNSSVDFKALDNGNLIIPSSVLSNLPKNLYYTISICNYKRSSENYDGLIIYKYSLYNVATHIFLTQ